MKKVISLALVALMFLSLFGTAIAAESNFADVKSNDWFYADVITAVELGLVNGKNPTSYAPNDNLTYAEAIKLAACMNQLYTEGSVTLQNGNPWYQSYVDYCKKNKITDKEYKYTDKATRAGYMEIFANALPDEALAAINDVPSNSIPDVQMASYYAEAVYKLYRAGILNGVDKEHRANPYANIKRSEVATILVRMMDSSRRVEITDMGTEEKKPEVTEPEKTEPETKEPEKTEPEKTEPENAEPEAKALAIKTQPVSVAAKANDEVTFTVEAEGGKAPYTYKWQTNRNGGDFYDIIKGTFNYHDGFDKETYKVTVSQTVIDNKQGFRCVITDADGATVTTEAAGLTASTSGGAKDKFEQVDKEELKNEDFSMTIDQIVVVTGKGIVLTGYISAGKVNVGDTVYVNDADNVRIAQTTVTGIEMFKKSLDEAEKGDNAGILIGLDVETYRNKIVAGNILSAKGGSLGTRPSTGARPSTVTRPTTKIALKITTQPSSASSTVGATETFTVAATGGTSPYTYQWYAVTTVAGKATQTVLTDTGLTISGSKTATLSLRPITAGTTTFYCVVTDAEGNTVQSEQATLTMTASTSGGRGSLPSGKADGGY